MFGWPKYVPVAQRRRKAEKALEKMQKKNANLMPVLLNDSRISTTAWGQAWCRHLATFSDYSNRLPRGRSYLRNGSVVHLDIGEGLVSALVQGSSLYKINIKIKPIKKDLWNVIVKDCSGQIESLVALLRGQISKSVMERMSNHRTGLFPATGEITLDCSCPDWADMCKHNAAVLYAVGNRLDTRPELLFKLRGVDPVELVSGAALAGRAEEGVSHQRVIKDAALSEIFGIDVDMGKPVEPPVAVAPAIKVRKLKVKKAVPVKKTVSGSRLKKSTKKGPEKIWLDQCRATVGLKKQFGSRTAFEYLVGEKLVHYINAASDRPVYAGELSKFVARINKIFDRMEIHDNIKFVQKKDRARVIDVLYSSSV
ncbi:MAG: SWIM zinc finger family protein [Candidatus Omnitrophica bacterium]|nr:SWIM zinc finger family protein [Candidatus Omnitrophota bacterium]